MENKTSTITTDSTHQGLRHVALAGAINATTVVEFQKHIDSLLAEDVRQFVIDFSDVGYINSTGMGSLVNYTDQCRADQGNLVLLNVHPKVKVAFDILGLDGFFDMVDNKEEAIEKATQAPSTDKGDTAEIVIAEGYHECQELNSSAFPKIVECKYCQTRTRLQAPGNYYCPACKATIKATADNMLQFKCLKSALPIALTVPYTKVARASVVAALNSFAVEHGFDVVDSQKIVDSVKEVMTIIDDGNEGDTLALFQVLWYMDEKNICIRFTDFGSELKLQDSGILAKTRTLMDKLQHKTHPKHGNILQISKTLRKK